MHYVQFIETHEKQVTKVKSGTFFNSNITAIRMGITIDVKPDTDLECIHFKNICYQISSSSACERLDPYVTGVFITKTSPYDLFYSGSPDYAKEYQTIENVKSFLQSMFSNIIPNERDLQFILYTIAAAVTNLESCDFLYLCGSGANG